MGGADKEKKAKVAERVEHGGSPTASPQLVESMGKLQDIQHDLETINERASEEVLELEKKFNELRKPVFARRNEVIGSIHEFWLIVFISHPTLGSLVSKEDEKILKHMVSLEVEEDAKSGYSIIFTFSPNPYFENTKITKNYFFDEVGNFSVNCEPIKWKEGKGITNNNGRDKGAKRPYNSESFVTWFCEAVRSDAQVDEIAEIIRDDLWPNPLRHLQNEVDGMGLYQEGKGEEVTGGGNEGMNEDEDDDNKEYCEEEGDDDVDGDDSDDDIDEDE